MLYVYARAIPIKSENQLCEHLIGWILGIAAADCKSATVVKSCDRLLGSSASVMIRWIVKNCQRCLACAAGITPLYYNCLFLLLFENCMFKILLNCLMKFCDQNSSQMIKAEVALHANAYILIVVYQNMTQNRAKKPRSPWQGRREWSQISQVVAPRGVVSLRDPPLFIMYSYHEMLNRFWLNWTMWIMVKHFHKYVWSDMQENPFSQRCFYKLFVDSFFKFVCFENETCWIARKLSWSTYFMLF